LQHDFPLDILMVLSSMITVTTDGEHLTCGGFPLGKTVHLGNFEFITDYFGGLSRFPRRGNLGAAFMGSTRSGTPFSWWAMIEDFAEEFLTASSGEEGFDLPSTRGFSHGEGLGRLFVHPPRPVLSPKPHEPLVSILRLSAWIGGSKLLTTTTHKP
jgi:hypothetical protein